MDTHTETPDTVLPPPAALLEAMTGYWISQAIFAAAELGIADELARGPATAKELAVRVDADASALHRLMRALSSVGIFSTLDAERFGLSPMAELLRRGTPDSMNALARIYAEFYRPWGDILYSVRTGRPAFEHLYGMPVFEWFARHPETGRVFNEAMTGYTGQVARACADAFDFSSFRTVVDVGGSYGTLLAAILGSSPTTRGILFDLPHVVSDAEAQLVAAGIDDRCTTVGGDFFESVPADGDAYVLCQILHDWDDTRCQSILEVCRTAMSPDATLLIVELVLPEGDEPVFGKWLDLHMMAVASGRERTAAEYDSLLSASSFTMTRVIPTAAGASIVEAAPTGSSGG